MKSQTGIGINNASETIVEQPQAELPVTETLQLPETVPVEITQVIALPSLAPTLELRLDQNPAAVYLARLRPTGRRSMRQALTVIAGLASASASPTSQPNPLAFPWHQLRYQHTAAILVLLQDQYKPATTNKMLSALRGVLKEAWQLSLMSSEEYHRAANLKGVRNEVLPAGRALEKQEIKALLHVCQHDHKNKLGGVRDAAILAVLYVAGLRRSELVKLKLSDFKEGSESLTVRGGKGGKDRICYLEEDTLALLKGWLMLRGSEAGALFCPVNRGGNMTSTRALTDHAILKILAKRAKQAGVEKFSPHDLRRTFISDLLDAGADIATVQKMAGHANVSTTARYDRRGDEAKRKAVKLLNLSSASSSETPL